MASNTTSITGTINQTSSGTTYITGSISGMDTNSLIESAVNARLAKATRIDDKISANTVKISAYQQLQTLSKSLQTSLEKLKSTSDAKGNTLVQKSGNYTASDGSGGSNILSATISKEARNATHTIIVQQLAKAMVVTSDAQSSTDSALGLAGSFDIALEGGTAATITITADMALTDIKKALNDVAATSGVSADIMQTSGGQYKLVLSGNNTAESIEITNVSGDNMLQSLGVVDEDGDFAYISQEAQEAIITLDGTEIHSTSNAIDNVITGVNLKLINAAPGTTVTMNIDSDTDGIEKAITDFIDTYNALRDYILQNQSIGDDGEVTSDNEPLFGDSLLRAFSQDISAMISNSFGEDALSSLRSLGITLDSDNKLSITDEDALEDALSNNLALVQSFFATTGTTTGFANSLYSLLDNYTKATTGAFDKQVTNLQSADLKLQQQSDDIKDRAETYRQTLINKYANMEARISAAQLLQQQIEAILKGSRNNDS